MTGFVAIMLAGGNAFVVLGGTVNYSGVNTAGGGSVSVSFFSDGTVNYTDEGATGASTWGTPTPSTGAGNAYWITFGAASGTGAGTVTGASTGPTSMATTRTVSMTGAGLHTNKSATIAYTIYSDSGGTNTVQSGTVTLSSSQP